MIIPVHFAAPAQCRSAVARLWLLARALREPVNAGQRRNCTNLAVELEVATKTIQRDLEFLREFLRHDIVYDAVAHVWSYRSLPTLTYL